MQPSRIFLGLALAALAACGEKKAEQPKVDLTAQLQKVKSLHAQHIEKVQKLREVRDEFNLLRDKGKLTASEKQKKEALAEQVKAASKDFDKVFTEDQNEISAFLNIALNDAPQAPETREGLKIYAEDAMMNAQDYMSEAGDYRKAIELLETVEGYFASISAPPPQELLALKEEAKKFRFITKERFDQVQKGMTRAQVRAVTGTPLAVNVREQEVKGHKVTVWLFRSENGDVASFFFDESGKLYSKNWKQTS